MPDLDNRRVKIRTLEQVTNKLNDELQQIGLDKYAEPRVKRVDAPAAQATLPTDMQALERKEQKLRQLLDAKKELMDREQKEVERMQEALGIVDPNAAAAQNQMLQVQLSTLNNSIIDLRGQLLNLETEIDKYDLAMALAQDPQAKEARAEEELAKDETLKKLDDKLVDVDRAIKAARNAFRGKGKENPTVQRLLKEKATLEDKLLARRDELLKNFSDDAGAAKLKELERKKKAFEKHRSALKEQLAKQEKAAAETADKLKVISRDTADLENRRQKIKKLEEVTAKLADELQRVTQQKNGAAAQGATVPPSGLPADRRRLEAREQKLKQLLKERAEQLEREMKEIQRLQESLGIGDSASTAGEDGIRDPEVLLRAEAAMSKDDKLKKLEDKLGDISLAIEEAEHALTRKDNPTVLRLLKEKAALGEKIQTRRDELLSARLNEDPNIFQTETQRNTLAELLSRRKKIKTIEEQTHELQKELLQLQLEKRR